MTNPSSTRHAKQSTRTISRGKPMQSRLYKIALTAAAAIAPMAAATAASPMPAATIVKANHDIVLSIGRGQLINVPGKMTDVFVADESIANVQLKSQRQLYVYGKSGGETTIYASDAAGNVIWSANIRVGSNIGSIPQMLAMAMPRAHIKVATMGTNTVLLTGTVAAPQDAAEAEHLVKAFVGKDTNVVSRLNTATPLQVNLRVRFAEVSRSLVRQLGANLVTQDTSNGFVFGLAQGRGANAIAFPSQTQINSGNNTVTFNQNGSQSLIGGAGKFLGMKLGAALDLGETEGLVTTLSEPNLTALSGETATFLAGGEFPIPLSQGLGTTTIEYKKYGVSLAYTPTVLANGEISIRVRPEVSELSSQGAITLNGFQVPALTTRRAETTVILGSGQSFMIAGLLSNNAQNTIDKAPGLGDLPILGSLFKSTQFQKGETELVIVVTPYLVKPVDSHDIHLPTDGFAAPNAGEQFLLNREQSGRNPGPRPQPRAAQPTPPDPAVSLNNRGNQSVAGDEPKGKDTQTAEANKPGFSLN